MCFLFHLFNICSLIINMTLKPSNLFLECTNLFTLLFLLTQQFPYFLFQTIILYSNLSFSTHTTIWSSFVLYLMNFTLNFFKLISVFIFISIKMILEINNNFIYLQEIIIARSWLFFYRMNLLIVLVWIAINNSICFLTLVF